MRTVVCRSNPLDPLSRWWTVGVYFSHRGARRGAMFAVSNEPSPRQLKLCQHRALNAMRRWIHRHKSQ